MSTKVYDQLIAAGAPELPAGWFYRVNYNGLGYWRVAVLRRRKWWLAAKESSALFSPTWLTEGETATDLVAAACSRAVSKIGQQMAEKVLDRELRALSGDHP